ncbi:MAG: response regulator [Flavisolibacter sp.]|nr:response regulator [Flavisolibacter sp.]
MNHTVLCIDDDPDDLQMLREALSTVDPKYTVVEASDGVEGMAQLEKMKQSEALPCLVVLDINMPKMDGRETFLSIRSDKELTDIPVVVFSTSNSMMDKMFFERKNVAYFTKPINFHELVEVASEMLRYCHHN